MRPTKDAYFLQMAALVATRATCLRRSVGCVLVDTKGRVLSTGYNGVPAGCAHCNEHDPFHETGYPNACASAFQDGGGTSDSCLAIHAEMNAILMCGSPDSIHTAYVTVSPCMQCAKVLMNTGCQRIVFSAEHHRNEARKFWTKTGRLWECGL